jgi:hypothetical protein
LASQKRKVSSLLVVRITFKLVLTMPHINKSQLVVGAKVKMDSFHGLSRACTGPQAHNNSQKQQEIAQK